MNVRSCRRAIEGQPLLRSIVFSNANSFGRFLKACPKRIVLDVSVEGFQITQEQEQRLGIVSMLFRQFSECFQRRLQLLLDGFTAVVLHGEHFTLLRRAKG